MKIYTVYKGEVHSVEVKETPKLYVIENTEFAKIFDYRTHFRKTEVQLTPEAAIEYAYKKASEQVKADVKRLQASHEKFESIKKLIKDK